MRFLCYDTALNEEYTLIRLLQQYPRYGSLFTGTDDEQIWDAAPYLFEVDSNFYELRGDSSLIRLDHCMLLETGECMEAVVQFLQQFIYRNGQTGLVYFRIWDPRVLLREFAEWSEKDRVMFFEFFDCFYTEAADEALLDQWKPDRRYELTRMPVRRAAILPDREAPEMEPQGETAEEPQAFNEETAPVKDVPSKRRRFFIE
ncbi:DUF4123 domain-containing protein [Niabella sp. CC-SYL272]|uniref:DUF4123 domain-containing protein n=1 Tax=Niabella agricola TaxID=2891571 RepID=UPI001F1937AF|nr:DUF4123 domain-containing protein [Niabella agricola]MCF3111507.1 DUF4123 domain-containing protein [Niabella agricola]